MSLNHSEIDLILKELNIQDGFLQNIHQPDYNHIIFDIYGKNGNKPLLISLHRDSLRICETQFKWKRSITLPRFSRFLRSRIKGSNIKLVKQVGKERIIEIKLSKGEDQFYLFIKLWGGSSNIILTDSKLTVLDSFTRRPKQGEAPQSIFDPYKLIRESPPERKLRNYPASSSPSPFNDFIDKELREAEKNREITQLREKNLRNLEKEIQKIKKSYKNLLSEKTKYSDHLKNTSYGDYIKANLYRLKDYPKTTKSKYTQKEKHGIKEENFLIVEDYEVIGLQIKIPLNPQLSPMENANKYYKNAIKGKRGLSLLEEEIKRQKRRIEELKTQAEVLKTSTNIQELKDLWIKLSSGSEDNGSSKGKANLVKSPGLTLKSNGYNILIGRSSEENDQLLRKYVRGSDYWLHTRDYPGGYVFIKSQKGKPLPQNVLLDAANLAVFFSKAKKNNEADLYYTQVKYLRRAKGGKKGTVLPTQEKNIFVKIEKERLSRLLK